MATDPYLLDRIRILMESKKVDYEEKKMFGGHCFMVDDKMCFGTYREGMMLRVAPEDEGELIRRKGAEPMVHGGRPMKGYLYVLPEGFDSDSDLAFWVDRCLEFNPRAKSSKKK